MVSYRSLDVKGCQFAARRMLVALSCDTYSIERARIAALEDRLKNGTIRPTVQNTRPRREEMSCGGDH